MAFADQTRDLSIRGLCKNFGTFRAIDHIDLDIRQGEFLTLLGPSGSGKTTLLMMIAGFVTPDAGTMSLGMQDITRQPPEKRSFGMVFQGYALFPHLSVRDNVAFPLKVRKVPAEEIRRRVDDALDLVQLGPLAGRLPRQLSGGQQQRVALARAMVFTPHLLLLDEPLSALDKKLRAEMQDELKRLHRKVGLTFIYVTHDQDEALSMSDRIVVMKDGRISQQGTPQDLYRKPANTFVAGFLGRSNILRGAGNARFALRPEAIRLLAPGAEADTRTGGHVVDCSFYGANFHLSVQTEAFGPLEVAMPASTAPDGVQAGQGVTLGWNAADAMPVEE